MVLTITGVKSGQKGRRWQIETIVRLHRMIWGPWMLVYFLGAGLLLSIRLRFFQIWGIRTWWGETIGALVSRRNRREGNQKETGRDRNRVTSFQSACTALAATIGTGNIAGVATALTAGGPGALFWMWISAVLGMATAYAETCLGQRYRRRREDGRFLCGPMVYMERGLGMPAMGIFYAVLAALASLGVGSMVQSNAVSSTLRYSAGIPGWLTGICVTILVAVVITGGTEVIARFSEKIVPVSAGIYFLFCVIVILSNFRSLPGIVEEIIREAVSGTAVLGGIGGYTVNRAMRVGLSRGVFSNEAGLGSLAILHGVAQEGEPETQGMWAMLEVFLDTVVICTLTGLVILCIRAEHGTPKGLDGAALTSWCFARRLGRLGEWLVSGAMISFAFATIIAWYYLGRQTVEYLGENLSIRRKGREINNDVNNRVGGSFFASYSLRRADAVPAAKFPYPLVCIKKRGASDIINNLTAAYTIGYLAAVLIGCISRLDVVWLLSDIGNALMACPNLLTVVLLRREVTRPR